MGPADLEAARALADVASIAVLQHRASLEALILNEQLNHALNNRIVIEQAKGMVAEREGVDMAESFSLLRTYARNHNLRLADVARSVIDGVLPVSALDRPKPSTAGARSGTGSGIDPFERIARAFGCG